MISPRAIAGSQRSFWAFDPWRRIEPATSELVTETTDATTQSTRAISSQIRPYVVTSTNDPPYSSGIIGAM